MNTVKTNFRIHDWYWDTEEGGKDSLLYVVLIGDGEFILMLIDWDGVVRIGDPVTCISADVILSIKNSQKTYSISEQDRQVIFVYDSWKAYFGG